MKSASFFVFTFLLILIQGQPLAAQFDDMYYSDKEDAAFVSSFRHNTPSEEHRDNTTSEADGNENLDEYSYSSRINRFHRNRVDGCRLNNFDSWWGDYDSFNPYYGFGNSFTTNVFLGSPMMGGGFNPWNRFGWNRWSPGWGFNNWGFNNWGYSPWGFNDWSAFGGFGNTYFINYYGWGSPWGYNGWNGNGNGWNGTGNGMTEKVYLSRKGGSVSSSVKGRDASPRRVLTTGDDDQRVKKTSGNDAGISNRTQSEDKVRRSSTSQESDASERTSGRSRNASDARRSRTNDADWNSPSRQTENDWNSPSRSSGFDNQGSFRSSGSSSPSRSSGGSGSRRGGGR